MRLAIPIWCLFCRPCCFNDRLTNSADEKEKLLANVLPYRFPFFWCIEEPHFPLLDTITGSWLVQLANWLFEQTDECQKWIIHFSSKTCLKKCWVYSRGNGTNMILSKTLTFRLSLSKYCIPWCIISSGFRFKENARNIGNVTLFCGRSYNF